MAQVEELHQALPNCFMCGTSGNIPGSRLGKLKRGCTQSSWFPQSFLTQAHRPCLLGTTLPAVSVGIYSLPPSQKSQGLGNDAGRTNAGRISVPSTFFSHFTRWWYGCEEGSMLHAESLA